MANAAVTGVGAAATASSLTSTASGLKGLDKALTSAEESVANYIGNYQSLIYLIPTVYTTISRKI